MNDIMRGKIGEFKERKIEYYTLLVATIMYPLTCPLILVYALWSWGFGIFDNNHRIIIFVLSLIILLILYPLMVIFINSVKDFKPGNKFLTVGGIDLKILKKILIETLDEHERGYDIILNKEPDHNFSEVLYRKEIFAVKLENESFMKIKKDRYFPKNSKTDWKCWNLQYDGTQVEEKKNIDTKLLQELSKRLEKYIVD